MQAQKKIKAFKGFLTFLRIAHKNRGFLRVSRVLRVFEGFLERLSISIDGIPIDEVSSNKYAI